MCTNGQIPHTAEHIPQHCIKYSIQRSAVWSDETTLDVKLCRNMHALQKIFQLMQETKLQTQANCQSVEK